MYMYSLVDGIYLGEKLEKTIFIKPLSDSDKNDVEDIVGLQFDYIQSDPNYNPVNEKHQESIYGLMLLNERASASIAAFGNNEVNVSYADVCSLKMTAQDWNIVLTSSMAVDELHNGEDAKMLA